jgi:uracil-DNA glycosylase
MDAREALRRYLEQRRDLGESELVLDSMSVDEALKLLGAGAERGGAPRAASGGPGGQPLASSGSPETDWRAAIRAAGGEPEARESVRLPKPETQEPMPKRPPATAKVVLPPPPLLDAVHIPATEVNAPVKASLNDVPTGIVVGGAARALFEDPAVKLDSLDEVAKAVATCRRCSLYATATNPVPGVGNPNAGFMCVGEAPGAHEDAQGEPFVGQAGQLLNKILEAIKLKREDVFIANVLKHRPPGNRNPTPDEVVACSPYLVRQIELIRPKVILALGTFAAQTLLETKLTIGKLRGQVHRYYGVPLVVTYHPAALLRNPSWKRPTWEDVQLARRILDHAKSAGA